MSEKFYAQCPKTYQASANEEYRQRDVFEVLRRPPFTPASKVFQEDVGGSIEEYEKTFDKFCRWLPLELVSIGPVSQIPCPTHVSKTARPATQGQQAEPEKDTALYPVS